MQALPVLSVRDYFYRLLTAMWLRPERALFDAHLLHSVRTAIGTLHGPSMEYGCTDGVPSFVLLGGIFADLFDDYVHTTVPPDRRPAPSDSASDYFDHFDVTKVISPAHVHPQMRFTWGISWKHSHIAKAHTLDLYESLSMAPLGSPLAAVEGKAFKTIFAPNLFWIDDHLLENTLHDLAALLAAGGRLITIFPDVEQRDCLVYTAARDIDPSWAAAIDRGISCNLSRHSRSLDEWNSRFLLQGLQIEHHSMFLPAIVSTIYQIGMRPMFPVFMQMSNTMKRISDDAFLTFKRHWIEAAECTLRPFLDAPLPPSIGGKLLWHTFVLSKT